MRTKSILQLTAFLTAGLVFLTCNAPGASGGPGMAREKQASKYTTCQLIQKNVINKGGKIQEYSDYYLRCSIQDYPVKLCESSVTGEQLHPYLNQGITVRMEIKEGMLDHCDDNPAYAQSRTGRYAVILEIKE